MPGRKHYSTRRWLTRRARKPTPPAILTVGSIARSDRPPPARRRVRSGVPDCTNCNAALQPAARWQIEPKLGLRSLMPGDSPATASEHTHAWQMPAPVRRLDTANRQPRSMLKRQLAPGVVREIATLVTTGGDAVLTTVCVRSCAIHRAPSNRNPKVCPRHMHMSLRPACQAVVDSTRYTRISTIGVDLSTLSWYIRQRAQACAHASARRRCEYCAMGAPSVRETRCGDRPMLMKSPKFRGAGDSDRLALHRSGLLHRCSRLSV